MPKRKIPLEKDYIYHVYNRWFEKQIIFRTDKDYKRFIIKMKEYNDLYIWIKVYSYCLLPNHFHLIISSSKSGLEISDFMRKLQQSCAMYFKTTSSPDLKIRWQFFEWRFKAKIIKDDIYLSKCLAYVNYNSIKHNLVDNINDYPWTSYHQLVNKKEIDNYKDLILYELEF